MSIRVSRWTKAFDRIRYISCLKFWLIGVPAMALRALLDVYQRQVLELHGMANSPDSSAPQMAYDMGVCIPTPFLCVHGWTIEKIETEGVGLDRKALVRMPWLCRRPDPSCSKCRPEANGEVVRCLVRNIVWTITPPTQSVCYQP